MTTTLSKAGANRLHDLIATGQLKATHEAGQDGKPMFVVEHHDLEDYLTNGGAA